MAASNSSETVRVIVRCRPMNQREMDLKSQTIITMNTQLNHVMLEHIEQTNEPPKQFTFDAVYPVDSITENIYADSVFPLVESVLEGYNATVFAYGQTGCGKSFTMQGINTPGSLQRGVIPRSFEHIFEASSVAAGTKYLIRASYLEIYNESIRDLLGKDVKATLDLKEYADKGVQVPNLSWHQCTSVVECERLMDRGNKSRATGATSMNKDSSRSHSIFTILTEMCTRSELDGKDHIRAGKLNLVDLAGSERQSKTHAEGERLREATRINLSLSALGNVISALVDSHSKHIPYRDSKLTRLLQDSLGGNTKTLMIAAISPAHDNYDETLSTLRYANRAKNIKNKPHINEDPRDAQMKLLQEEINRLKQELVNTAGVTRGGNQLLPFDGTGSKFDHEEEIEREKERLRAEFEREASELRRQCQEERVTKEELQRKYNDLKGDYDTQIDALGHHRNSQGGDQQSFNNDRNKGKKENNACKQKRDGQMSVNDQYENDDTMPVPMDEMDPQEKLERLQELENKLIGGEELNNEERKKKRKKKLNEMREKQEQKKRFTKAIDTNNEDMMMRVFDNAQEELYVISKKLEQSYTENKRLKIDNDDLQHEFERDRQGYLNTIRAQEKQLLLYRTILEKMSSTLQRNCNYSNIDKIIEQARYDEERNEYIVPDPMKEEVQFPQVGHLPTTNGRTHQSDFVSSSKPALPPSTDYECDYTIPSQINKGYHNQISNMNADELERRYGRNVDKSNVSLGRTLNKRQEQLLNQSTKLRPLQMNNTDDDYMNRRLNPFEAPARLTRKYGSTTDKQ
ncbi:unnamed protein product [Rotaria magnacalcarata]|uniref:Kinesin-like protein n=2 Tax=Rotaria magnacalcarata TaxID=392030 RepID=A0A814ZC30_9BILA|nr:unnamed protein product [Rotaria magnacalcarata]CAF1603490.1 unnamed protein product [Rotaria magnacalcarata]CAF2257107.1 unnamed protein product [Rotaria magnacalcarata]